MQRATALAGLSVCMLSSQMAGQTILYVDNDAAGFNDGSTWDNAFFFLQDALARGNSVDEIWVAAGTYTPDKGAGLVAFDRNASFQLVDGLKLYGGFASGETSVDQRDIASNPTILSGDLGRDDILVQCTADLPDCASDGERCFDGFCVLATGIGENSYTIVSALGVDASTVLDGFTITGGNADGPSRAGSSFPDTHGAGVFIKFVEVGAEVVASEPIVRNCSIEWNSAQGWGAGLLAHAHWETPDGPTITDSTFYRNTSYTPSNAALGGGIYTVNANTTIIDCTFRENAAVSDPLFGSGGAIGSQAIGWPLVGPLPTPHLLRCTFINNWAEGFGGAMYDSHNSTVFESCKFIGNRAVVGGGYANIGGTPTVVNSMFVANTATEPSTAFDNVGGGLAMPGSDRDQEAIIVNSVFVGNAAGLSGGGIYWKPLTGPSEVRKITNTIVWGNTANGLPDQIGIDSPAGSEPAVTFCDIQSGWTNVDCPIGFPACNINADPLFADADGLDDLLGTLDDDFHLSAGSPCIDAGDNSALSLCARDLADNIRFMDVVAISDSGSGAAPIIDIGPYEFAGTPTDCNANNVHDACDVDLEASDDCNGDFTPDECQLDQNDCNVDLIPDDCQLVDNDCDANDVPDECQSDEDCNVDGVQDICEIASGAAGDCNSNQVPDECDIGLNGVPDENLNGVPDDCEGRMNRYVTLVTAETTQPVAYRVDMTASAYFPESVGMLGWVGQPDANGLARVVNASVYRLNWSKVVFVGDCEIVPAATYQIRATVDGIAFTNPPGVATIRKPGDRYYGDVVGLGTGDLPPLPGFTRPNGVVNVTDMQAYVLTFQGRTSPSAHTTWVDLHGDGPGSPPNFILNVSDLQRIKFGFEGQRYTDAPNQLAPADCP